MRNVLLTLATSALLSACGGAEAPAPTLPEPPPGSYPVEPTPELPKTFRERLLAGIDLALSPSGSGFQLAVTEGEKPKAETRPFEILEGGARLALDAEGQLSLSGLEVALEEIVIGPDVFPPNGLHVVDVRAGLELRKVETSMSEDATLGHFTGEARLWVNWALLDRHGQRVPLRPIDARAEVGGTLRGSESGPVELEILGDAPGTVLLVADRFGLSDVSFSLQLAE